MSTPASAALNDSAGSVPAATPNGAGGTGAAAPSPSAGAGSGTAANQAFFATWDKPEQKEVRDWVANKNYADPFILAKSARELESTTASLRQAVALKGYPADTVKPDGTVVPADVEARKAWNASMGVPETADKYDIPVPAENPYPQFKNYMAEEMHKVGVPASMATSLAKGYEAAVARLETELRTQENVQSQAALHELEREWGSNYQERVALAGRGKEWLSKEVGGMNDMQLRAMESILGTPKFMAAMWKIGAGNKEAGFAGGSGQPGNFGNSAQAAQTELDQLTADRSAGKISDLAWRDKSKRVDELVNIISGGMKPAN